MQSKDIINNSNDPKIRLYTIKKIQITCTRDLEHGLNNT